MSENVDPSAVWRLVDESVAALPASDRLAVRTAVANSVLEGWQPTKVDVDRLAAFALGADHSGAISRLGSSGLWARGAIARADWCDSA